ncbi:MAG: DUF58 domain-containing protein [Planctomycetota bacterium]
MTETMTLGSTPSSQAKKSAGVNRTFAALAVCSLVICLGMLSGASLWIIAAAAAAILVALNSWLASQWSDAAVAIRLGDDREVKIGSRVPIDVEITNQGRVPILWLLAEDLMPRHAVSGSSATIQIEGDRLGVFLLMPQETRALHYDVLCKRRGYLQIGPTVLETGDLMGLYRRYHVGTDPQYITVLPDVRPLSGYEIGSRRPVGEIRVRENIMDDPTRLRGIRQWQPGDPMRSVHWAATARTGTLHSKVYEPSSIAGATLILDFHQETMPAKHEPVRGDLAVAAAASIATGLHEMGEPFGMVTNGRDAGDRIRTEGWTGDHRVRGAATQAAEMLSASDRMRPILIEPSRNTLQLKEIIRTLARVERTDGLTLAEMLVETEPKLSRETTLLVLLQECPDASAMALCSLARRGWAVSVIINTHDIDSYSRAAGPLIAENIPTFHLPSYDAIYDVCRSTVLR